MKKLLNVVAKAGLSSAKSAVSINSWWYIYQPQEPKELKKFKK
ncbi:cyclic lactone autoinducer peptide [Anaerosporobacter sp.]